MNLFRLNLRCATALILLAGIALHNADAAGQARAGKPVYRVAVARFSHETCTFCPGGDSTIEDWLRGGTPRKGNQVLNLSEYVKGFTAIAREYGDMELIGLTSPIGVWGGSSRSWNTEEAFNHFVGQMLEDLREAMPVDGVFLSLHGAMAVRNIPRPEAEMARRFREVVGPDVPIVGTFDLHGNEDEAFLRWADGSFVTKRYPHYDSREQGERAARYLRNVMRGTYRPATAVRRPPILTATVLQWTGQSPVMDVMERARRWENRQPGVYVNVFLGFPWADVPTLGTSVHVMTNNDQKLADEIADDMAEFLWRTREEWASGGFPGPEEAVRLARQAIASGERPVVLADYWDRLGDGTWTLRELIEQGMSRVLYAALTDERALETLWKEDLQPGDPFDMAVGGYTGAQAGNPVPIKGTLLWRGAQWGYDRVAAIQYGEGNVMFLVPAYQQIISPRALRVGPVDPDQFDVFVLKTRVHFRRGFDETGYARAIHIVDAPGDWFGTVRLEALDYRNANVKDFYPFGNPAPDGWRTEREKSRSSAGNDSFPSGSWERYATPEEAGFSSEKLRAVREATHGLDTAAMMIIHRGRVVEAWGDIENKYQCHSIRKSFLSALYGIQVAGGKINLDATMADLGIDDNLGLSEKEKQATVRMLLKGRSGVYHPALYETRAMAEARPRRHAHDPGAHFYYNNWDFNALGTIYEQETGEKIHESFAARIAGVIGMEDFSAADGRYVTGEASRHAAYPFVMSARDLARFGLLYLNGGKWNGQRILPESWVQESVTAHSEAGRNGGYGYLWWIAVDGRHFDGVENVPEGTYTGRGSGGHVLAIVPRHDLVVVHRVNTFEAGRRVAYGDFGKLLMKILEATTR